MGQVPSFTNASRETDGSPPSQSVVKNGAPEDTKEVVASIAQAALDSHKLLSETVSKSMEEFQVAGSNITFTEHKIAVDKEAEDVVGNEKSHSKTHIARSSDRFDG